MNENAVWKGSFFACHKQIKTWELQQATEESDTKKKPTNYE